MKKLMILLCTLVVFATVAPAQAEKWNVDPAHSSLNFSVEHLGLTYIDGTFNDFSGVIEWDPQAPATLSVNFTAKAKSINTNVAQRDEHLRSADFFEVDKHPTLTFQSTKVKDLGQGRYQVDGDLSIHGVTKSVSTVAYILGPKEVQGGQKIGFRAPFKINRLDYKVGEGKFSSADLIGHDVYIEVKGEAAPAK